jgi:hypothetical protein
MPKSERFTFKKQKPLTGLMGVGNPYPNTTIKHDKMVVGYIYAPTWQTKDGKWSISLKISDPEDRWHWSRLKARFDSEPEARNFLNTHAEKILSFNLHHDEPDEDD